MRKNKKVQDNLRDQHELYLKDIKWVDWPGVSLGTQDFRFMNGLKVLSKDLRRGIRRLGYDCLLVYWPNKTTDSYIDVSNVATFIFVDKDHPFRLNPWDPWEDGTGGIPTLNIEGIPPVVEIHSLREMEYCGTYFLVGYAPLVPQRDIEEYEPCVIDPNRQKFYFKNKIILEFLEREREARKARSKM